MRGAKLKLVVAIVVIVGALLFLMAGKLKDAFRYSEDLSAIANLGPELVGRAVRIQGKLVDDSLVKRRENGKPYYELQVTGGGASPAKIVVRYDDLLPDNLVNGSEVTAEGSLTKAGYFHATKLFAKCPSKYDEMPVPEGYRPPDPYSAAGRSGGAMQPKAALPPTR
jgi:cytochrome c-type biogenesis protein CcmE